jgi:hypothetical protein
VGASVFCVWNQRVNGTLLDRRGDDWIHENPSFDPPSSFAGEKTYRHTRLLGRIRVDRKTLSRVGLLQPSEPGLAQNAKPGSSALASMNLAAAPPTATTGRLRSCRRRRDRSGGSLLDRVERDGRARRRGILGHPARHSGLVTIPARIWGRKLFEPDIL